MPEKMTINVPDQGSLQPQEVDNPLYTYKFSDAILDGEFGEFDSKRRSQMYRCNGANMSYPYTANENIQRRNYGGMVVSGKIPICDLRF